jgi:hypothetical protein
MARKSTDRLTPNQEKAIAALLNAPTIRKAAEEAAVSERALYKWLKEPTFKTAYRDAQREAFKHSIALTQKYLPTRCSVWSRSSPMRRRRTRRRSRRRRRS